MKLGLRVTAFLCQKEWVLLTWLSQPTTLDSVAVLKHSHATALHRVTEGGERREEWREGRREGGGGGESQELLGMLRSSYV